MTYAASSSARSRLRRHDAGASSLAQSTISTPAGTIAGSTDPSVMSAATPASSRMWRRRAAGGSGRAARRRSRPRALRRGPPKLRRPLDTTATRRPGPPSATGVRQSGHSALELRVCHPPAPKRTADRFPARGDDEIVEALCGELGSCRSSLRARGARQRAIGDAADRCDASRAISSSISVALEPVIDRGRIEQIGVVVAVDAQAVPASMMLRNRSNMTWALGFGSTSAPASSASLRTGARG